MLVSHTSQVLFRYPVLPIEKYHSWSDVTYVSSVTELYLVKSTLSCQTAARLGYVPRIGEADLESFLSSRTLPLVENGWPSKEVAATHAVVEEIQEEGIAMLGPLIPISGCRLLFRNNSGRGFDTTSDTKRRRCRKFTEVSCCQGFLSSRFMPPHGT